MSNIWIMILFLIAAIDLIIHYIHEKKVYNLLGGISILGFIISLSSIVGNKIIESIVVIISVLLSFITLKIIIKDSRVNVATKE